MPLTNVHFHLPALPEPSTRQVQQELLALPGVLEGITMVFVPAVTTFVISQLMGGGKVPLIGDIIQNQFGKSSDWHFGSTLSLLVMVVVLAFMGGLQRIDKEEEPRKEVRIL